MEEGVETIKSYHKLENESMLGITSIRAENYGSKLYSREGEGTIIFWKFSIKSKTFHFLCESRGDKKRSEKGFENCISIIPLLLGYK